MSDEEFLLIEGPKFFPRCIKKENGYSISKRMKGVHQIDILKRQLLSEKIYRIARSFTNELTRSMSSPSVYFIYNGINYRVSNHASKRFDGEQIIIDDWRTDISSKINNERSI